jgi:pyruvate formate lyase activating enzyme
MIKQASYWESLSNRRVVCTLCPAECTLTEGKVGICGSRRNDGGQLLTDNYGEVVTIAVDPIEKKPLYHFYPSSDILSTGANGCNFKCQHCQNWTISQEKTRTSFVPPEQLVEIAMQHRSLGVAFTYTEPVIWYEYIVDAALLLREAGLKTVLVSNGYINPAPLAGLVGLIDAANIDLKSIRGDFYRSICKGKVEPVLENIAALAKFGVHLEITNLIIPGLNDSDRDIEDLVSFVAGISDMIPLHFSAYRPDYKMNIPATPIDTLLRARQIASEKMKYVYLGNVDTEQDGHTRCPKCGHLLIRRDFFRAKIVGLKNGRCTACDFATGIIH